MAKWSVDMATVENNLIPPELMAELQEAAHKAAKGLRDPEEMRKAAEEMDRIREANRKRFGVQNIGVDIIREMRGEIPDP